MDTTHMENSEVMMESTIDAILEVLPSVWDRIRSNFRSAGTGKFGISLEQFHTLRHIYRGYHHSGEIAQKRQISCSAVSQAIDALVAKGLVVRTPDPGDRRQVQLDLTAYARQMLDENVRENRAYIRSKMGAADVEERTTVVAAMDILKHVFLAE